MGRVSRSTKKLAQRIDLNYFKRLYPIPRWRRILSYTLVAIGLVWLGWGALSGKQAAFNAGPLAHSHALFTRNCAACHAAKAAFGLKVTDQACLACHDGAMHQAQQTFTPACTECHVEHQGASSLSATRDESCTQCHSNLKTNNGTTLFAAKITSFENGHPEFAALRSPDPGTVKFGHAIHLKSGLRGPHGPVQLKCGECHSPAGGYMAPVTYEKDCASCHSLEFDARFSEPAPHKKPEVVIDYVTKRFTEYIATHPDEVFMADPADPRILRPPMPPARDAQEWIERRITDTKVLLWRKTCVECHTLTFAGNRPAFDAAAPTPNVPEAAIPSRWMKHAVFDHVSHQMLICTECHTRAAVSEKASDVMIPGIDTCRNCHRSGSDAAESRCFECHLYHDRTKSKIVDGALKISAVHP
jgi:hypothetical protein